MRLEEIRTKIEGGAELLDRGVDLFLREEYPTERIVGFGAARLNCNNSLEVRFRRGEVALLQRGYSLPVDFVGLRGRILGRCAERRGENAG